MNLRPHEQTKGKICACITLSPSKDGMHVTSHDCVGCYYLNLIHQKEKIPAMQQIRCVDQLSFYKKAVVNSIKFKLRIETVDGIE